MHIALIILHVKKGIQQTRKQPESIKNPFSRANILKAKKWKVRQTLWNRRWQGINQYLVKSAKYEDEVELWRHLSWNTQWSGAPESPKILHLTSIIESPNSQYVTFPVSFIPSTIWKAEAFSRCVAVMKSNVEFYKSIKLLKKSNVELYISIKLLKKTCLDS